VLDLLIEGATIVDGSGSPPRIGALAFHEGRLVAVGPNPDESAIRRLDAEGLCAAPGFIDIHTHSDLQPFIPEPEPAKVLQGVTTEIVGNCGYSAAPLNERSRPMFLAAMQTLGGAAGVTTDWHDMNSFLARLEDTPLLCNIGTHVGHGTVRAAVCGMEDRQPSAAELERMRAEVATALAAGAFGLSSGLIYPPGAYANTEELTALADVAASFRRAYFTHIRDEGHNVLAALDEALAIGRQSGAPVHIAHLKVTGKTNWDKQSEILRRLRTARAAGQDVTFDQYPYTASSTTLITLLPAWSHAGGISALLARLGAPDTRAHIVAELRERKPAGAWEDIVVCAVTTLRNQPLVGRSIAEIARLRGVDPTDALINLCHEESGLAGMIQFSMSEANVAQILTEPEGGMVASDGLYGGKPHPRAYGTFARVLGRYVREQGVLTLPAAIARMTTRPADRLGIRDRGRLAAGTWADVVLFEPNRVRDEATFAEPRRPPSGIHHVFVNGVAVVAEGRPTGARPGRVLRSYTGRCP